MMKMSTLVDGTETGHLVSGVLLSATRPSHALAWFYIQVHSGLGWGNRSIHCTPGGWRPSRIPNKRNHVGSTMLLWWDEQTGLVRIRRVVVMGWCDEVIFRHGLFRRRRRCCGFGNVVMFCFSLKNYNDDTSSVGLRMKKENKQHVGWVLRDKENRWLTDVGNILKDIFWVSSGSNIIILLSYTLRLKHDVTPQWNCLEYSMFRAC